MGLRTRQVAGAAVLSWAATGRRYFSPVIGLGVVAAATPEALHEVLDDYASEGISMFLLQSLPHCRPAEYEDWLDEGGLEPFDAQDRLVRGKARLASADRTRAGTGEREGPRKTTPCWFPPGPPGLFPRF